MKLLVAVDLSDSSAAVIAAAAALAARTGAEQTLLHVAEPEPEFVGHDIDPPVMRDGVAARFHEEHRQLQALAQGLRERGHACTAILVQGATVETILREADKVAADLIVLGSHGKGVMKRLVLGSVSDGVLRQARVPVVVVPTMPPRP